MPSALVVFLTMGAERVDRSRSSTLIGLNGLMVGEACSATWRTPLLQGFVGAPVVGVTGLEPVTSAV